MLGVLVGGLFIFAFGGMLLILALGARRIEDEIKAREAGAREARAEAARIPRFFVVAPQPRPRIGQLDDALLWQVQQYLEAEQTLADEFVLQPSIENLYRETGRRLTTH